jgi:acyl carrier protein
MVRIKMDDLIIELAEALDWDISKVREETLLTELQWDSMAVLTLIALARVRGITVSAEKIRAMKTVGDILIALREGV